MRIPTLGLLLAVVVATAARSAARSAVAGPPAPTVAVPTVAAAPNAAPADSSSRGAVVAATLDGRTVTLTDVDRRAAGTLARIRQEEYEARAQALDAMLDEAVLAREAEARHVDVAQLTEAEVARRVTEPDTAAVRAYHARHRAEWGGSLEPMRARVVEAMRTERTVQARADLLRTLRKKYGVRVALEPPRVAVSPGDDPARGPLSAPITIVEFSDFQCPYCGRAEETIDQVLETYGDRVRLVFRDFPLDIHPNAEGAAIAARCARAHGKYWEMNRALFRDAAKLARPDLVAAAASIGLDSLRFRSCLDAPDAREEIRRDVAEGQSYGVSATPTFFVNGVMIVGARELALFTRTIDRELERLGR
jgi:protein-disulfide isomerase